MGNITDHDFRSTKKKAKARKVLMAYTLNNAQPVLCTLLNDEPYFYMDEPDLMLEEEATFLDDAYGIALEEDILEMKRKIDAYEKTSLEFVQSPDKRFQDFLVESDLICSPTPCAVDAQEKLQALEALLSQSRMAQALMGCAEEHGVSMRCSAQVQTAFYDRDADAIVINPELNLTDMALVTLRALRAHWQHRQGAGAHPLTFEPDQAILVNRAIHADLCVAMIRCAWELQLSGAKDTWGRLENSTMGDLARAFAREAFVDFRALNNGKASSAVFETWFLSERSRSFDRALINDMLADRQGYVFGEGVMPRTVTMDFIAALGEQPFGKNYLASFAAMIIEDPLFSDVRDRSNANFLWFVKFEQSFKETECALQSQEGQPTFGIRPRGLTKTLEDKNNAHPPHGLESTPAGSNIIHVAFGTRTAHHAHAAESADL